MTGAVVEVGLEVGPKRKVFAQVVGWPGWVRAARDEARALAAVVGHAPRYATVVARADLTTPTPSSVDELRVTERVEGGPTTDFGALERLLASDLEPMDAAEIGRSAALLEACWATLDEAFAAVPVGIRGTKPASGRAPAGLRLHVAETDAMHLSGFGTVAYRRPAPDDVEVAEAAVRAAIVEALRAVEPGVRAEPRRRYGFRWTPRFVVRRAAWHALDHAWELQDRAGGA